MTEHAYNLAPVEPHMINGQDIDDFGAQLPDSLGLLLNDSTLYPLLDARQEVELAEKIEQGKQAAEELAGLNGNATEIRRQQLSEVIQLGSQAKELFISSNVRLVVSIAKRTGIHSGVALEDRVGMGMEGLLRGIEKFDHTRGFKFSTYGTWWIKQSIQRHLANEARTVRLPVHTEEKVIRINVARQELERELNREPTDDELSDAVGFNAPEFLQLVKPALGRVSLNSLLGDGEDELGDILATTDGDLIANEVENNILATSILQSIDSCLDEREYHVIRYRFGLDGEDIKTFDEIGQILGGITRERVRQIELKAKQKLAKNGNLIALGREMFKKS